MQPAANGHCGRSHLAFADFASAVWPGWLGRTFAKRVLLMHNQDCNTMQIHVLSYFSLLFFFFFSHNQKESLRNFTVADANALQDRWLIKGASLRDFRVRRWNPSPRGNVCGWLLWKWDPRSVCRQSLPLKWQILFYLCDVGSSKRAGTFVSGCVQACEVILRDSEGAGWPLAFSTPV